MSSDDEQDWLSRYPTKLNESLDRLLRRLDGDFDTAVRDSFLMLEERIREAAGLDEDKFGVDLVQAAFHPQSGILRNLSQIGAERQGLFDLFHGAFLFYRNPVAHRNVRHTQESALNAILLVSHLLYLIQSTLTTQARVERYLGAHEGRLGKHRRYFRIDLDSDGEKEQVILLDTGPVSTKGGEIVEGSLITLILGNVENELRRIPCDPVHANSLYGPYRVQTMMIAGGNRPDLVVSWTFGETQLGYFVLRWHNGGYTLVPRDYEGLSEPYAGIWPDGFMTHPTWQDVQFVDYDGDGLIEIIHILGLPEWGMPEYQDIPLPDGKVAGQACRVYKWNAESERLSMIEETILLGDVPRIDVSPLTL